MDLVETLEELTNSEVPELQRLKTTMDSIYNPDRYSDVGPGVIQAIKETSLPLWMMMGAGACSRDRIEEFQKAVQELTKQVGEVRERMFRTPPHETYTDIRFDELRELITVQKSKKKKNNNSNEHVRRLEKLVKEQSESLQQLQQQLNSHIGQTNSTIRRLQTPDSTEQYQQLSIALARERAHRTVLEQKIERLEQQMEKLTQDRAPAIPTWGPIGPPDGSSIWGH